MNKRELVWLLVRLIGVYFAYLAIVSAFTLVGSISAFYSLNSDTSTASKTETQINTRTEPAPYPNRTETEPKSAIKTDPMAEKAKSEAFKSLLFYLFLNGLYGGVAFYLMAKGSILFNVLNREDAARRAKEPMVTSIRL